MYTEPFYLFTYLVLSSMSMIMIGPGMLDDDVFGDGGTEGRGVDARGARLMMMPCRLDRLRGRGSPWRGALLLLGLVASADPAAAVAAIIAGPAALAATSTTDETAA